MKCIQENNPQDLSSTQKMTVEGTAGGKAYKVHCNVTVYGLTEDVVDAFNEALAAAIVKNGGAA